MSTKRKSIKAKRELMRSTVARRRRRRVAKTVAGAVIGGVIAGPVGAAAGAIAGASVRRGPVRRKNVLTVESIPKAKAKSRPRDPRRFVNIYPNIP